MATTGRTREASAPAPPTRALILDTAERLFSARGLDGVAVRDLAREMGITASSLYNHFPSKQALYDAVIERGLGPIIGVVTEAWQLGEPRPGHVQESVDRLTAHLARHPHLARLLQRALLEDTAAVQALLDQWLGSLYREGIAVVRKMARDAGWQPEAVPHLGIALFGMIFAYFTNPAALRRLTGWRDEPLSPRALRVQQRFLAEAVLRLLGPRPRSGPRRAQPPTTADARRRRSPHG